MAVKWTAQQHNAIYARGGGLLVSAAAGSGKTAVLVERVIQLMCDQANPVAADRLLVVTFSNAAAAEMRQRIAARLSAMIAANPDNLFLHRQQAALGSAQISTVHSFCLELIRQNFQNLEISPDFSLMDENELRLMKQECVMECIEAFYAGDADGAFAALVSLVSTGRDDKRLIETVLRTYEFCRSHPWPEQWMDSKLEMYRGSPQIEETAWGKSATAYAAECLKFCAQLTEAALREIAADEALERGYGAAVRQDLQAICAVREAVEHAGWDAATAAVQGIAFARLGAVRGESPGKMRVQAQRERVKKMMQELAKNVFCTTQSEFWRDLEVLRPSIETLFKLVKAFDKSLTSAKAERRRLDFSDLEHLVLQLLVARDESGMIIPSRQAQEIASRYEWILVDEYQDTNEVQDMIFTCVSRGQANLFMVGDVKQSIYSFRQAMPEIFIAKRTRFFPFDGQNYPATISLDTNFRSRGEVTGAVNDLFGRLMSERVGDLEYGTGERLVCGASYPEHPGCHPELLLLTCDEQDERDRAQREAAMVAKRIAELLESGYTVTDKGGSRPIAPRDICVLLRSPKGRSQIYIQELQRWGVPAWAEKLDGFLAAREVCAITSLLKVLDNPLLDIELAAVLLSPFFAFSDDELAEIRLRARRAPLFVALREAADMPKVSAFLDQFERLRLAGATEHASDVILQAYACTNALEIVRAMPMGEARAANLLLLLEYAAQFHAIGYKGLSGFVAFLRRIEERGEDLGGANALGDGANVVRVMSVHRSKGLEFPVVILADTARSFNLGDLRAGTLLHSRLGFACVRRNRETMLQYTTLPLAATRLETQAAMLSEELRILYVAMTRAKEKLILSTALKGDAQKTLARLEADLPEDGKLPPFLVAQARSYADWILMAMLHHPSGAALRELAQSGATLFEAQSSWEIQVLDHVPFPRQQPDKRERRAAANLALVQAIRTRAGWEYPYLAQTRLPAKMAVSAVAKGEMGDAYRFAARPRFLARQGLTAAERGNAMHRFMQFSDYQNARDNLEQEIQRLHSQQYFSDLEAQSLSRRRLAAFFRSPLANRIFAADALHRELKFMAELGRDVLGNVLPEMDLDSRVVVQGVADCVFVEGGQAVIVDYKTDAVEEAAELAARYAAQLALYREILADSLGVPVRECIIYSFFLEREILL